ncbi:hypothetical protein C8R45DRAFT_945213 [Mycena sanguinolenta]|nr:hypothetical protein C8R45DRAFT_945213 [Mycena sanguinolenta]
MWTSTFAFLKHFDNTKPGLRPGPDPTRPDLVGGLGSGSGFDEAQALPDPTQARAFRPDPTRTTLVQGMNQLPESMWSKNSGIARKRRSWNVLRDRHVFNVSEATPPPSHFAAAAHMLSQRLRPQTARASVASPPQKAARTTRKAKNKEPAHIQLTRSSQFLIFQARVADYGYERQKEQPRARRGRVAPNFSSSHMTRTARHPERIASRYSTLSIVAGHLDVVEGRCGERVGVDEESAAGIRFTEVMAVRRDESAKLTKFQSWLHLRIRAGGRRDMTRVMEEFKGVSTGKCRDTG